MFLRVSTRPKKERETHVFDTKPPNDRLALVFDTETTTDFRQGLRFGIACVFDRGRVARKIVFHGTVTEAELATIRTWAAKTGIEALSRDEFVSRVFLPVAVDQRAVVIGFNLPFDLSRIAAEFEPKRKCARAEAWTFWMVPRSDPKAPYVPRVRVQHVDSKMSFISFTGTKVKWRNWRGAFVDLRTFTAALTGEGHSLESAGKAFRCSLKKTEADYHGRVTDEFLDYGMNDVALTAELWGKCLERYREFGLDDHPSKIFSSASLGKAAFRARGVEPPPIEDRLLEGRLMAAFHAGKTEVRVAGREVADIALLDFTSQYPSLFALLRADRFLSADRITARDATEEVRAFLDSLETPDLFKRETWANPLMWSLCEVEADGDLLPVRSSVLHQADTADDRMEPRDDEAGLTLPFRLPDLVASKLATGRPPKIVRATAFEPVGRQALRPFTTLGIDVGPDDDLLRKLAEARIREKRDKKPGWEGRALGLKIIINAASYGVFVEVNEKRDGGPAEISGLDPTTTLEEDVSKLEEPGALFSPVIGTEVTSAAHLLLSLLECTVVAAGGEFIACDTDSAFITPSRLARAVAAAFDPLNPYSEPCPFLKDETPEHHGSLSFFGLSSKRYCLFERNNGGAVRAVKVSDHGIGIFNAPGRRDKFDKGVWEHIVSATENDEVPGAGWGSSIPVTSTLTLTKPSLWPRVRGIDGMQPFNFITVRHLANPRDDGATSELLPFLSTKEHRWNDLARDGATKTWDAVVWAFARHRDRKYLFGDDGLAARRSLIVRRRDVFGLGKEGGRYALRLKLGRSSGIEPRVFIDWKARLGEIDCAEAKRLGIPYRKVTKWRQSVRKNGTLRKDALANFKSTLMAGAAVPDVKGQDQCPWCGNDRWNADALPADWWHRARCPTQDPEWVDRHNAQVDRLRAERREQTGPRGKLRRGRPRLRGSAYAPSIRRTRWWKPGARRSARQSRPQRRSANARGTCGNWRRRRYRGIAPTLRAMRTSEGLPEGYRDALPKPPPQPDDWVPEDEWAEMTPLERSGVVKLRADRAYREQHAAALERFRNEKPGVARLGDARLSYRWQEDGRASLGGPCSERYREPTHMRGEPGRTRERAAAALQRDGLASRFTTPRGRPRESAASPDWHGRGTRHPASQSDTQGSPVTWCLPQERAIGR